MNIQVAGFDAALSAVPPSLPFVPVERRREAKSAVDKVVRLHAAHSVLLYRCSCGQCSPVELRGTYQLIDDLSRPSTPTDILHRMRQFSEVNS